MEREHEPYTPARGPSPGSVPQRVLVVGAGPTGLALAGELALAGVPCRVIERRGWRTKESRAFVLHARTMEQLALRGVAGEALAWSRPVSRLRVSTTGTAVEFGRLDSQFPHLTVLPQSVTEDVLEEWARKLGVEIIRHAEVYDLNQDGSSVTLKIRSEEGEWEERAAYAVGCDGAHSVVRQLLGVPFEGDTLEFAAILADVRLRRPPIAEFMAHPGHGGVLVSAPYPDGWFRVAVLDRSRSWTSEPVSLDELASTLRRVTGHDLDPYAPRWMARFRLHERLAERYRHGRVLLAGDAAHLHSPLGGQGLNVGIQDAFNLGWKLAATMGGWAQEGLLDSYEHERRPVAGDVIRATSRATKVMTATSPLVRAARTLALSRLLRTELVQRRMREAMSGIAVRYAPGCAEDGSLSGRRLPNVRLSLPDGKVRRLYDMMADGRFALLDLGPRAACASAVGGWADRVRPIAADLLDPEAIGGAVAVLVRPDGYVAWSTAAQNPGRRAAECRDALIRWCGLEENSSNGLLPRPRLEAQEGAAAEEPLDEVLRALDEALLDSPELSAVRLGSGEEGEAPGGGSEAGPVVRP
jgi:2-polyprenyl-6-methoxyphenol hydroxylase-like FAD-dependent oxidoreductase